MTSMQDSPEEKRRIATAIALCDRIVNAVALPVYKDSIHYEVVYRPQMPECPARWTEIRTALNDEVRRR